MKRYALSSDRILGAAVCCAMSASALGWTIVWGIRPPASRFERPSSVPPLASNDFARAQPTSDELIESALDHDPFSPTRKRPALRYGESGQTVVAQTAPAPEVLHLIGTVFDSTGASFVLCQLGSGPAHVVRLGQMAGPYQLRSISQGTAIFVTGDGQRLELRVPKTGS